jgi:mannose-6-phosphate isomerase-like protein (cupin superfamily)
MSGQGISGPRLHYRSPQDGLAAPEDYPDAPISLVLERSTAGADLFGVAVAIGGDIPLHYHSMMEFQYVVSGSGLALNADGAEIPISAGGTVISPAGPAGAHGFRNLGRLPLTLLCLYPSPGGATPDRSAFDPGTDPGEGPRTTYRSPHELRPSRTDDGTRVAHILDDSDPGAELHALVTAVESQTTRHHHSAFELQYVVTGVGVVTDADGRETEIGPGGVVACPAGPSGAHAFRPSGSMPLQLLCVSPMPKGMAPDTVLDV